MQRLVRRPAGDAAGIIADMMAGLAAFRLNRGDVTYAVVSALRNWTFDLFCLVFSIKAAGAQTVVISGHPPLCQDQVRHQGQPLLVELEG